MNHISRLEEVQYNLDPLKLTLRGLRAKFHSKHQCVALHGWLDNAASFIPLSKYLEADLTAIDLAGHGRSDHLGPNAYYNFSQYTHQLHLLAQGSIPKPFDLMGHSLGAGVAVVFAACFPNLVRRLVLIEGLGPLSSTPSESVERLRKFTHAASKKPSAKRLFDSVDLAIKTRMTKSGLSKEAAEHIVPRGLIKTGPNGWQWSSDPKLIWPSPNRYTDEQITHFLEAIECKVLIILGEDGMIKGERYKSRLKHLKSYEVETFKGSHHLHLEHPFEVAKAINAFLADRNSDDT